MYKIITSSEVARATYDCANRHGNSAVEQILRCFGVTRATYLIPSQYQAYMDALDAFCSKTAGASSSFSEVPLPLFALGEFVDLNVKGWKDKRARVVGYELRYILQRDGMAVPEPFSRRSDHLTKAVPFVVPEAPENDEYTPSAFYALWELARKYLGENEAEFRLSKRCGVRAASLVKLQDVPACARELRRALTEWKEVV